MGNSNTPSFSYRNDEEVKALLIEFEETVKEFCGIYLILETTFYHWRNKHSPKIEKQLLLTRQALMQNWKRTKMFKKD